MVLASLSLAMQGLQTNHSSVAYYYPGYNPYATGTYIGADGHCVSQPYFTPVTYGAEALPCYAWDYNYHGDPLTESNASSANVKSNLSPATTVRSNGTKPSKLHAPMNKLSSVSLDSKSRSVATNASQPKFDTQPSKYLNKVHTLIFTLCFSLVNFVIEQIVRH